MRSIIIIIFIFIGLAAKGQNMSFIEVDTSTYNQYLRGDWNSLIKTGKKAINDNYDYYYLQMRIAYAYFAQEKYRKSIQYYKNALNHSKNDPTANEYLYYSNKNSGKIHDAKFLAYHLPDNLKRNLQVKDSGIISFGINHSYLFSDVSGSGTIESIINGASNIQDGIQKATYRLNNTSIYGSHMLGPGIIIYHSGNFMQKSEFSYIVDNLTPYLSEEQLIRQQEYSLNASIRIAEGLIFTPGIHFLRTAVPIFGLNDYGAGMGRNRITYTNYIIKKYVPSVKLAIQKPFFDVGMSYAHHSFNNVNTNQAGLHTTLYPAANLNYYLTFDSYFQFFEENNMNHQSTIVNLKGGMKLMKNLWLELYATFPDQYNYYDITNDLAYNNAETFTKAYGANVIFPFYKIPWKLFFKYQYKNVKSSFFPDNHIFEPENQHLYNSQIITGGIIWTK